MPRNSRTYASIIDFLAFSLLCSSVASFSSVGDFNKDFYITWSPNHINTSLDGHLRTLKLDKSSGSGFASNDAFLFGQFDMQIRLIPGNSAGTVVAFYLQSNGSKHDEIDFEFLGNVLGKPYILQTNVFVSGVGNREERINLWFDPTEDFHTYSIIWDIYQIIFMVDWVPIRSYRSNSMKGVVFPGWQPMRLLVSLWDGESWATRGGHDKINWSRGPFTVSFRDYKTNAFACDDNMVSCRTSNVRNKDRIGNMSWIQRRLLRWVRKYHLIYDYCEDDKRFQNKFPPECSL
ncbi:probable xyloglucan endotransglucosylase/hydrolase protein 10 [Impatiens glandulifera]|uniref:probable xyloglucan endotransglucosylase/hydrolase protein 10 n=1 Tax=Impatiens glandulifera TaxID=253017 RepID=UPI001FB133CC|nr:probable xyloglucan endotransglucosylase/hydrolase protein 10 [Impatiens glandulifera]